MTVRALAQEATDDQALRRISEPASLAAERVTRWVGPDGQHWVHLWGNAAILHGAQPAVRAREAIVRISDESTEFDRISRVDIYAEGQVRLARDDGRAKDKAQTVIKTCETRLNCYRPDGVRETKDPPWQLQIIKRSGFREQKTRVAKPKRPGSDHEPSSIDARYEALARSASAQAAAAPTKETVPIIATQAVVRNQSADVLESAPPDSSSAARRPARPCRTWRLSRSATRWCSVPE